MDDQITIIDLMTDPELFGDHFGGDSWKAWRALLAGFYGLPLDDDGLALWRDLTHRERPLEAPGDELWQVIGRRGGKSQVAALIAVFEALFRDHQDRLSPGEIASVLVVAVDRKQARVVFRYISGLLQSVPMLARMIRREDKESIELTNSTVIEVGTASFRSTRGYSLAAVIADEIAFWRSDESANPDAEILAALRPALATLGGRLIALSSPYAKRGELWRTYRRFFGVDDPSILVAQASSMTMNPSLPARVVEQAKERDLPSALAEFEAQFRSDVEDFIDAELLHRLTRSEPEVLPPTERIRGRSQTRYFAFVDPAGGGADGFAIAVGHIEQSGKVIVDLVTERARKSPSEVVAEYATLLNRYRIKTVTGDRYAGQWVTDEFRRHSIRYEVAELARSDLYREFLALANDGSVELPPTPKDRLISQFTSLERRTSRSGRDTIDHPAGLHDDLANAVAGLCATARASRNRSIVGIISGTSYLSPPRQHLTPLEKH